MHKTALLATCAVAALFSSNVARGDWTGFYVGLHAGGILGDIDNTNVTEATGYLDHQAGELITQSPEGILGGGQLGFDYQAGNWLVGIDVSGSGMDFDESKITPVATEIDSVEIEWLLTASARLGVLWGDSLLYLKGGYATGDIKHLHTDFSAPAGSYASDETHNGFVVGAGLEHELGEHVSFGVEYNYIDLGNQDHSATESNGLTLVVDDIDAQLHTVTARLNFHWNPL